jgi:prepilin-type N-terminal cleavage/methylation domain-containing protein
MNPEASKKMCRAFTLIELLVVVAIVAILAAMYLPTRTHGDKAPLAACLNNLRQVSLGSIIWADANTNQFPWEVSTNTGGTQELIEQGNAAAHTLPITTNFNYPRLLICPTDKSRHAATNFTSFSNANLSYFISLSASLKSPSPSFTILAGDRHLSLNKQAVKTGLFETTNSAALGWTTELHNSTKNSPRGVLVFADGHGEVVKGPKLPEVFQRQSIATNRLAIP